MEREAIRKSAYVEKGEPHGGLGGRCAEPREPAVTPGQLAATHRGEGQGNGARAPFFVLR